MSRVLNEQGDCPICRAGFKPSVIVPIRDTTGNASFMTLPQAAYDKLKEIQREHEPLSIELCLKGREDEKQ